MSDYDRGAYTPQTDAPLAFDPRRPSERRPMPMALIGSGVVLAILLAGVAMVYRGGVRHAGDSPRPVGEPVMAVKTAPPTPAAASAPANMDVYSEGQGNATAAATPAASPAQPAANQMAAAPAAPPSAAPPKFAPAAEQPAPRPAPRASTVAMLAKPTAPDHIVRPATPTESAAAPPPAPSKRVETASTAAKTKAPALRSTHKLDQAELAAAGATRTVADEQTASDTDAAPADKPKKAVKTASAAPAPAAATPAPTGVGSGAGKAVVQIGAFSSSVLADKGYAAVSAALPGRMGGKAKHVQPLDKDGTTLYRTWLSGFASREDAVTFCEALKAKGKTCLVKG